MTKTVKILDTERLKRLNAAAVRAERNRALSDACLARLDPNGVHLIAFSMPHNDVEVRAFLMMKASGTINPMEAFLDMSFEDYAAIPTRTVPTDEPDRPPLE